jgi:hypothetical protein
MFFKIKVDIYKNGKLKVYDLTFLTYFEKYFCGENTI